MKKELEVAFRSRDYSDNFEIDKIILHLTDKDIENIKKASKFVSDNDGVWSVNVSLQGVFEFMNEDGKSANDWRTDVQHLVVYSEGGVFFYAQNKWDSGDCLESESFSINN
jgi:hypothetical protein